MSNSVDVIGVFTFLSGNIDRALDKFIIQSSTALSAGLAPLVVLGLTMWFTVYGMAVMRGEVQQPTMGFVKYITKLAFILAFALGSGIYQSMIVEMVQGFLSGLVQIFSPGSTGNIFETLDTFDNKASEHAMVIMGRGFSSMPLAGYADVIAGFLVLGSMTFLLLLGGGFALMAKVSLTLVLAFGPLFISCLAFPPISKYFDAWLGKVLNYVLLIVLIGAVLAFQLTISSDYIDAMIANVDNTAINALKDAAGLVMLNGALLVVTYHLPQLAAGLTGGVPLSGGGLASMLMGKILGGKGGKEEGGDSGKAGGSVSNTSSDSTGSSSNSSSGTSNEGGAKVPAYRRATLDRLHAQK